MKRITTYLTTPLFLSLALCFFTGCSGGSEKTPAKVSDETTTTPAPADTQTAAVIQDTTAAPPPPTEEPSPAPNTGSGGLAPHEADEERLSVILDLIAQDLEAQQLEYRSDLGQDCSGIYHKIKDMVQRKMKELGDKSKYTYPSFSPDRNTREIAHWYHRHNNLHIVQDGLADRNLIRPGSVMFFGRTDESYSNLTIDMLTNPGVFRHDAATGKGKIYHVATVTKVERDEEGNVVQYTIMHGRNSKHTASRTGGNWETCCETGKMHQKFPFGNHNQQWVAVANIETAVE